MPPGQGALASGAGKGSAATNGAATTLSRDVTAAVRGTAAGTFTAGGAGRGEEQPYAVPNAMMSSRRIQDKVRQHTL